MTAGVYWSRYSRVLQYRTVVGLSTPHPERERLQTFADRLKWALKAQGLSESAALPMVGTSSANWSRWLAGQVVPKTEKARAIGAALAVRWEWLLTGEGEWRWRPGEQPGIVREERLAYSAFESSQAEAKAYREMAAWALARAEELEAGKGRVPRRQPSAAAISAVTGQAAKAFRKLEEGEKRGRKKKAG